MKIQFLEHLSKDESLAICKLLNQSGLPTADFDEVEWVGLVKQVSKGQIVGFGGIEAIGGDGLLRSVVVDKGHRGKGLAQTIVEGLHQRAKQIDVQDLYLMTTNATSYFTRCGYQEIQREHAPDSLARSTQFSQLCPGTAAVMWCRL